MHGVDEIKFVSKLPVHLISRVFFSGLNRSIEHADVKAILEKPSSYCPRLSIKYSREKKEVTGGGEMILQQRKRNGRVLLLDVAKLSQYTYRRVTGGGGRIQNSFSSQYLQLLSPSFSEMQVNPVLLRKSK